MSELLEHYDRGACTKVSDRCSLMVPTQAVFAAILNTSKSSVQKWEIGQKRPTGTALKLLHLVQKNGLDAVA
jgi:DNA-binding transcriptional regulator YiaG